MDQYSGHDIPPAICLLTDRRGHDLGIGLDLQAWLDECSPDGGSDTSHLAEAPMRCSPTRLHRVTGPLTVRGAPLLPALVLAALGGAYVARRRSLWYDELYTAEVAPVPLGDLLSAVASGDGTTPYLTGVPPSYNAPYYVVMHLWLALPGIDADDLGLRLASLLAAVAAVAVLTAAVSRLAGSAVGVTAGLVAATNPLVVEYAAEARGYGLAMLATAVAALGLVRWLDGGRLLLYATGAALAGLAHWFALPVVAGLALAGLVLERRRVVPLAGATVLAVVPALLLVALTQVNGIGDSGVGRIREGEASVPERALGAWVADSRLLLLATLLAVGLAVVVAVRSRGATARTAVVGACWVVTPLTAVALAELVRPVFVPRYLLAGLLGLAVLAGLGVGRLPLLPRLAAAAALLGLSLSAVADGYDRGPREDARGAVALVADRQVAGEPVVAVDRRAALALDHYAPREHPRLLADLVLPPDDPHPGAEVVWLVRQSDRGRPRASDDDAVLAAAGLRVVDSWVLPGTSSDLVVQRWAR
jgi:mannosyltransferase